MPLVTRAVAGATQGVMQVATSRPQNQTAASRAAVIKTTISISNKLGLHARASAKLTKLAGSFQSEIHLSRNGRRVNAKSIMGVMMLAAGIGSEIEIETDGEDEQQAMTALRRADRRQVRRRPVARCSAAARAALATALRYMDR